MMLGDFSRDVRNQMTVENLHCSHRPVVLTGNAACSLAKKKEAANGENGKHREEMSEGKHNRREG